MPLRVVVVGAGPVGCVSAIRIARMPGTQVTLIESRALAELAHMSSFQRAYCMAIRPRGKQALEPFAPDLPSLQHDLKGIVMVPAGPSIPVGADSAPSHLRAALAKAMSR